MQTIKKIILPVSSLIAAIPAFTAAQVTQTPDFSNVAGATAPSTAPELVTKITLIIHWIQYGLFIAGAILIVIAAYDYLFSKGDAEKIKTAQSTLIYAVIALVIGLVAGGLPSVIGSILGYQR